tara:strand:- start:19 stop:273 length:255 start_codon:yes stop_codon:yes gene_type:complete
LGETKIKPKAVSLASVGAMTLRTSKDKVFAEVGDMITIISPWEVGVDYVGLVTEVDYKYIHVYHSDINRQIIWSRYVKCKVEKI